VFDDHPESHEFLSPGGSLFEALAGSTPDEALSSGDTQGHCWLVEPNESGRASEVYVMTQAGPARVNTLGELLDRLDRLPPPGMVDMTQQPSRSRVYRLA
jgi:hypothetical protein